MKPTKDEISEWWKQLLAEYSNDGKRDAESGVFEPPHTGSDDPQDEDENAAYKRGFDQRRKELGDTFKWT